jgi:hypothetical protein
MQGCAHPRKDQLLASFTARLLQKLHIQSSNDARELWAEIRHGGSVSDNFKASIEQWISTAEMRTALAEEGSI